MGNVNTGSFLKAGTILGEEALLGPDTGGCGRGFKAGLQPQLLLLPHLSEELWGTFHTPLYRAGKGPWTGARFCTLPGALRGQ